MTTTPYGPEPDRWAATDDGAVQAVDRELGRRSRSAAQGWRERGDGPFRGFAVRIAVVLVLLGLCGAAWSVPAFRSVLRDSFTERQQSYIELSFGKDPWFDGNELVVPLQFVEHGDSGGRHTVKAWVQDAEGRRLDTGTDTVTTKPGALIAVDVRLRLKGKGKSRADLVDVTLPGHPQHLRVHLR
ncbi:hypothetical protein ABZT06_44345 [Streptomyces sp. NPDC005483]|uniref:hypothetical protein n=1 Tax=Streptomyces sp. NPDC005483 TaxID=3154882 RepID=UPI0033B3A511